jgi:hypothetical protein
MPLLRLRQALGILACSNIAWKHDQEYGESGTASEELGQTYDASVATIDAVVPD